MALDTRAAAARTLARVMSGNSLNSALPASLERVAPRDRGLLQQLCYGTLRQLPRLQGVLDQLLDKPLRDKDRDVRALLLLGLYQLDGTRVPDHAAVSATVGATRALKKPWARGLTNALLRRYLRERQALLAALPEAAAAAHPEWLYRELQAQWPEHYADMVAANNNQPPMTLRSNALRGERQACLQRLAEAGIQARAGRLSPQALTLETPLDVSAIPGFAEGDVSVQDEAAQLAAQLLAAQPGERVLDACAAPGGKSCHILELQPQLEELVAMDVDATRLQRVEQNLSRLGLEATLLTGDAGAAHPALRAASFDRILVDAPCSASGVIRRHPDVKLLRRETDITQLAGEQRRILEGLWPLLKPGGLLLYVTCSVLTQENRQVVEGFLGATGDAQAHPLAESWGLPSGCGRQLLPRIDGPDGLFYAALLKAG